MSTFTDLEKDAASVDGFVSENGLIPTRRNGPKPSYQYLVDGWNAEIAAAILELNKSRGFRVVGTFADGFTYELFNDVGIDEDGNSWIYVGAGAPNKVVPAGTVPSVGAGYEQVTFNVASGVLDSRGTNVQDYIDGNLTPFKTVADMKAAAYLSTLPELTRVEWQGYYSQSDGGDNWGVLRFGTHTEDGGSVFSIDANTYIEANFDTDVNVIKFGAKLNNVTDDADKFTSAKAFCESKGLSITWSGDAAIYSNVDLRRVEVNAPSGSVTAYSGALLILGNRSNSGFGLPQKIHTALTNDANESIPVVRVIGSKGQSISITYTTYLQLYADSSEGKVATDGSCAYSAYYLNYARTIELTNNTGTDGTTTQWINENDFYCQRIVNIKINGTYAHNHNKFHGGTLENNSSILCDVGYSNKFMNLRLEENPGASEIPLVRFGVGTWDNEVEGTWDRSVANIGVVNVTVIDNGNGNSVHSDLYRTYDKTFSKTLYPYDVIIEPTAQTARSANMRTVSGGSRNFFESGMIPCLKGAAIRFSSKSHTNGNMKYRFAVKFFGVDGKFVLPNADQVITDKLSPNGSSGFTMGTGSDTAYVQVKNSGIRWCKVYIQGSFGQDSTVEQQASSITCSVYNTNKPSVYDAIEYSEDYSNTVLSANPTAGFAPVGYRVRTPTKDMYCSFSKEVTCISEVVSGSTSIEANSSGVTTGDLVGVDTDTKDTEWFKVTGVTTNSIAVDGALAGTAAVGNKVYITRFTDA